MAHDVFISYSSKDKPTADAVVAMLESHGIRCWVAPRDVLPGVEYAEALVEALHESRLMVLVFSADSNRSQHVLREVERAVSQGIPLLPLRIENVPPSRAMEYYISSRHWLDALTTPLERHLEQLAGTAKLLLSRAPGNFVAAAAKEVAATPSTDHSHSSPSGGFPLHHAMANSAVLSREGQGAVSETLHSIATAVQDASRQIPRWLNRVLQRRRQAVLVVVAALLMLVVAATFFGLRDSNPVDRAEQALASGKPEAALHILEGVRNKPKAALVRGRALYSLKRPDEGIAQYKDALGTDPGILTRSEVLQDLAQNLGGRQSQEAVDLLVQAGNPAVDLLAEAAGDSQNPRRSRAAADALRRMNREDRVDPVVAPPQNLKGDAPRRMKRDDRADPVLVHLQNLKSKECAVVSKAAKSLGELGDKRAIGPLREIAARKMLLFEPCEVPAARAALRKLEKK